MRITWKERLEEHPMLRRFDEWPIIPLDSLPRRKRKAFLRNQQIMAQALNSDKLKEVARKNYVSCGRISQLLDRCLGGDSEQPPVLTAGLIPYRVVVEKRRQRPLATLSKQSGSACAFKSLLVKVPGLVERLEAMIMAKIKDSPHAQQLTPMAFHGEFKRLLREAHWPQDQYPYTTASLAYESVRRYLDQRTDELTQAHQQRRQPPPRDLSIPSKRYRALRKIQIDEHVVDLQGRVNLMLNDELIPLRHARANVLVAMDVDTSCVLGYYLAPTGSPNQQDMLTLLDNCVQPWQPLELSTPGLSYMPGACFPSGLEGNFPISFGVVQLDNALMHRAQSVINLLCEHMGASISYGLPGMPKVRALIESIFDYINDKVSHRPASTSGSYPTDPKRESRKNLKNPPVITFQTLNEALSIVLTEHNITPMASLGYKSPLALFEHHCSTHFVRYVPNILRRQWQPFISSKVVSLHWYKHENRLPHISFQYERYYGPGLIEVAGKERRIRVQFNRRDIRTLQAFTMEGIELGALLVSTPWQRFPHSLALRAAIHKQNKQAHFNMRDPLADHFRYLLENRGKPDVALSLLRVYTEFTAGSDRLLLADSDETSVGRPSIPGKHSQYLWHTSSANHCE